MKGKGFTLIELLIVIAIIGILVSITIPIFAKYRLLNKLEKGDVLSDEELKRYNDHKEEYDGWVLKRRGTAEEKGTLDEKKKEAEVKKAEEKPAVEKDVVVEASQSDLRLFKKPAVKDAVVEAPTQAGSIPPIPPIQ